MDWKILIALNEEPLAVHAANVAVELARSLNAELAFVYVIGEPSEIGADGGLSSQEVIRRAKEEGKDLIAAVRQRTGGLFTLEFMPVDRPPIEIVRTAKEWPGNLIVIGSHGRGGMQRALQGSVAESVMRNDPCPVLVVKAEE
jgi:nucleotide-binding universal stress UspA family protein